MAATLEEFQRIEIHAGKVVSAEEFPEARKPSYKLRIDFGPLGIKSSSVAVARWYRPSDLQGRLVVAVTNFPPRQIGPFRSEVLVLGAVEEDGRVILLRPDEQATPGCRIA